jgi:serine O-acetyltransferase
MSGVSDKHGFSPGGLAGAFLAGPAASPRPERGSVPRSVYPKLKELMRLLRGLFFPGFFDGGALSREGVASALEEVYDILSEQIRLSAEFSAFPGVSPGAADEFMKSLPEIRDLLDGDVTAAYEGDPAAKSDAEVIVCYPSIHALTHHRVAHRLYGLSVPILPRVIGEMAHSRTGIDIHPGASIGGEFFIDHGTGVVIGETSVIGRRCKLYQGVTLGAFSFPKDENGLPVKGIPRHPILEDGVTIYSGATVLGRVTIGAGSTVGANVWIAHDIPPGSTVVDRTI